VIWGFLNPDTGSEKVQAALNTLCPKCNYSIPPAEIRRVDFETMKCPKCGEVFAVHPN
jgi:ribosomal protein S27AE